MAQTPVVKSELTLSQRVSRISISSTAAVVAEADRLRAEGVDVVDFGVGEPDFPTPENVKEAAIRAIREDFSKYTAIPGTTELRKAIVERHAADLGTAYSVPEVIATAGGKQAIYNLVCSFVNAGDEVILPVPYWVTFYDVINYAGGKPVLLRTEEEQNFELTAEMVKAALTPKTRLVIVNSPSNPSGAVVPPKEFERILEVTASHGALLLSDECYSHLLYEGSPFSIASVPGAKDHVVVVGSLSKTYAMTGWRVGYALGPAPLVSAMTKLQSHSTSNPSSIAQKAAIEALRGPQESVQQMVKEYRRRRDFVIEKLRGIPGISCTMPGGAFYAYPNVSAFLGSGAQKKLAFPSTNEMAKNILREVAVALVPGEAFGTEQHCRLSYATSMEKLDEGMKRLNRFFSGQAS